MNIGTALIIVMAWYAVSMCLAVKRKGLDPSLVTYLSPLRLGNFWAGRLMQLAALGLMLWQPHLGMLACTVVGGYAAVQVILLLTFQRSATQPIAYFWLVTVAAFILPAAPVLALPVFAAQEVSLAIWNRSRAGLYRRWVARQAAKIHRRHGRLAATMPPADWFHVLHIATTESIARPKIVRLLEKIYFYIKRPPVISTGIMQVRAKAPLSDKVSMEQGARIITGALRQLPANVSTPNEQLRWLAKAYNGSTGYSHFLRQTYPGVVDAWKTL